VSRQFKNNTRSAVDMQKPPRARHGTPNPVTGDGLVA